MKVRTLPLCIPNSSKKDKGVNQQYKRRQPKKIFAANNMRRRLLLAVSLLVFISATALSIINSKLSPDINIEQIHGAIQENDFCVRKFSGTDYIINSHSVAPVGWQIVAINAKAEITKEAQETLLFNMIFAVVMAGIGVLISVFFISRSLSPLYDTINVMEKVEAGDLNVRANVKCTEEIAYLNGKNASYGRPGISDPHQQQYSKHRYYPFDRI